MNIRLALQGRALARPRVSAEREHPCRRAGRTESGTKVPHSEKGAIRAAVTVVWFFMAFYAPASVIERYRNPSGSITVNARLF
jgi:hypothetical protein